MNTLLIVAAAAFILAVLVIAFWAGWLPRARGTTPEDAVLGGGDLARGASEQIMRAREMQEQSLARVTALQNDFARYVRAADAERQDALAAHVSLARQVLILADMLDGWRAAPDLDERERETAANLRANLALTLRAAGIRQLPVQVGATFSSSTMTCVERREAAAPHGTVIEIRRDGYECQRRSGGSWVLRPAEVVTSLATPQQSPNIAESQGGSTADRIIAAGGTGSSQGTSKQV